MIESCTFRFVSLFRFYYHGRLLNLRTFVFHIEMPFPLPKGYSHGTKLGTCLLRSENLNVDYCVSDVHGSIIIQRYILFLTFAITNSDLKQLLFVEPEGWLSVEMYVPTTQHHGLMIIYILMCKFRLHGAT